MMASSTTFSRAGERVWESPGVVSLLLARGESEGWPGSAGRRHVLARSGRVCARPGVHWASRARLVPANGLLSLVDHDVQRVQEGERKVADMVVHSRKEWRGE
jgi:hypothetical protein